MNNHFCSLYVLISKRTAPSTSHFSTFPETILLKNVCVMENSSRTDPWTGRAICIHLSGCLTKAVQDVSLPWALLRGQRIDKDKQSDLGSRKWPFAFSSVSQLKSTYRTLQPQDQTDRRWYNNNTKNLCFHILFHVEVEEIVERIKLRFIERIWGRAVSHDEVQSPSAPLVGSKMMLECHYMKQTALGNSYNHVLQPPSTQSSLEKNIKNAPQP